MKIGITKMDKPEQSKSGTKEYEYFVWFRTSDGELHKKIATSDVSIMQIIEKVAEEEAEVHMDKTNVEVNREEFLKEI